MTTTKLLNLLLKSCKSNPYGPDLSLKDNINAAIDLANLCIEFINNKQYDEAMNLSINDYNLVIIKLKEKLEKINE